MIRWLHPFLIAVLVLTGTALGAARGQAKIAGQMVICSGGSVMVVTVDRDGNPVERPQFCPDMALSLLAAAAVDTPATHAIGVAQPIEFSLAGSAAASRPVPALRARDPPGPLV